MKYFTQIHNIFLSRNHIFIRFIRLPYLLFHIKLKILKFISIVNYKTWHFRKESVSSSEIAKIWKKMFSLLQRCSHTSESVETFIASQSKVHVSSLSCSSSTFLTRNPRRTLWTHYKFYTPIFCYLLSLT